MKKPKNYDKKVKSTRILLSDYLLLKGFAQRAGVSMSEALHKIITRQDLKDKPGPAQIPMPVTMAVATKPAFRVTAPVALPYRPQPALATNGHKSVAFRIKPKGVSNA